MNVYGPYQDQTAAYTGVIPIMFNKIQLNEAPLINGDGSQAYDFITVEDVAKCNILAMRANANDEFFNVGTGVQTTIRELCETILKIKKSNLKVEFIPYQETDQRQLVRNRIGSITKAAEQIGFKYQDELETGLINLDKWRMQNGI
jgi:UDP-glucose 4-epimerase